MEFKRFEDAWKRRCRDCAYLVTGADGVTWECDDCGRPCAEILDDECSANEVM